jgi:phospholipid transport system substrate-binding protein
MRYFFCLLLPATMMVVSTAHSTTSDPAVLIEETVNSLFEEFTQTRTELENDKAKLFDLVERVVGPVFDFDYISKLVLAKSWKSASDNQKQEFAGEFRRLMIVTYATALFRYTGNESMQFGKSSIREKKGKKIATVNTAVRINDGEPIPVVYSMIENDAGQWKIFNLSVGDLNMVLNYRSVIQASIHSEGLDGTIASMKENNDRNSN